jgi:hypothetical protein
VSFEQSVLLIIRHVTETLRRQEEDARVPDPH